VVVANPQGLHARPADLVAKTANRFAASVFIIKGNERVDAKSILNILMLAATEGTELSIETEGEDAEAALEALASMISQKFAEEE